MLEEVFFMCERRIHHHHVQNASTQTTFVEKVGALQRVLKELRNPFREETADLLVLDPKTIADPTLAGLVGTHQKEENNNSSHLWTAWRLTIQAHSNTP